MVYVIILGISVLAIVLMGYCLSSVRSMAEGPEDLSRIARIIREGADVFMRTEYRVIVPVVAALALIFSLFIEATSGITFILGAAMSSLACVIGMKGATFANVRVTNVARLTRNLGDTTKTATKGGAISGLAVQGFGLMGFVLILIVYQGIDPHATGTGLIFPVVCNPYTTRLTTYSLGCSVVATMSASILIAQFTCSSLGNFDLLQPMMIYAIALAGGGLLSCVICIVIMLARPMGNDPSKELDLVSITSAVATMVISFAASAVIFKDFANVPFFKIGWASPCVASLMGIISGIAIGKLTEYYTSTANKPVKNLAQSAVEGAAFVITKGDALGSKSCLAPLLTIVAALFLADFTCGDYGIAVASLGMLSFVAATVSIDAFGPIADNAGGIAEVCHLDPEVREITDQLDAVGNTTAAIGKGFAIGSAAFATISLIKSYISSYSAGEPNLNAATTRVVIGFLVGAALIEFFSAILSDNTIDSATKMADEGARQLQNGILAGTAQPDYNRCIKMATEEALHKMLFPSLLPLLAVVFCGFLLGPEAVGGLLLGGAVMAVPRAMFHGNSGGAFDNAKKAIEAGMVAGHGKGSDAHVAAVIGDTVGDTRKDVVGVALDIFIKTMSTVANTLAPVFCTFHLL